MVIYFHGSPRPQNNFNTKISEHTKICRITVAIYMHVRTHMHICNICICIHLHSWQTGIYTHMLKCPNLSWYCKEKEKSVCGVCVCVLSMPFTSTVEHHRNTLLSKTELLMQRIDGAPLSGKQKVKTHHYAMPAKMSWT